MSLLRSRAEIDQEPRTISFEVQRACPVMIAALGFDPWQGVAPVVAQLNPEPFDGFLCGGQAWRTVEDFVTDESGRLVAIMPWHKVGVNAFCEHMGRIIE